MREKEHEAKDSFQDTGTAIFAFFLAFLMIGAPYGTVGLEKAQQTDGQLSIQITNLQSTLVYLFYHSGQTIKYSLGRNVSVIVRVSTVTHQMS
ncbi:MAG: hypothetical protein QXZ17_16000 [Nitrososphaerota archaeon]